jgi:hypothetical protein
MGVASTYWMQTIDVNATALAVGSTASTPAVATRSGNPNLTSARPGFVDPALASGALGKPAPTVLKGARY